MKLHTEHCCSCYSCHNDLKARMCINLNLSVCYVEITTMSINCIVADPDPAPNTEKIPTFCYTLVDRLKTLVVVLRTIQIFYLRDEAIEAGPQDVQDVVVVYHVTIVAFGHGFLKKFCLFL